MISIGVALSGYTSQFCMSVLHVSTLVYRIIKRRQEEKANGQPISGSLGISAETVDSHLVELYRVCWIVFFCTSSVFLFECIEVAKTFLCKRRVGEILYHSLAGISFLTQGKLRSLSSCTYQHMYTDTDGFAGTVTSRQISR